MYEKIVRLAFEKAAENVVSKSITARAKYLEDNIQKSFGCERENGDKNFVLNAKTYVRYYNKYVSKKSNDFINPSQNVLDGLAIFLGFKNFNHFKVENSDLEKPMILNFEEEEKTEVNPEKDNNNKYILNPPSEITIKNRSKLVRLVSVSFIILAVIANIWLIKDLLFKDRIQPQPITIIYNTYNGNLNYYYAQKENGAIVLYENNGQLPNNNLKPVTQEVMLNYFKQQNITVTDEDSKRWFKENLKEEAPKLIEEKAPKPIEKTNQKIEVKEIDKLPIKNIKVTIKNDEVVDQAISIYFENNYNKTNENYTVTGDVSYTFKESTIYKNLVICNLSLTYSVKLIYNNKLFDSRTIVSIGSGFSNIDAKQNAISKIRL